MWGKAHLALEQAGQVIAAHGGGRCDVFELDGLGKVRLDVVLGAGDRLGQRGDGRVADGEGGEQAMEVDRIHVVAVRAQAHHAQDGLKQ